MRDGLFRCEDIPDEGESNVKDMLVSDPPGGESLSEASPDHEETSTLLREEEPEPAESGQGQGGGLPSNTVATTSVRDTDTRASNFFVLAPLTGLLACPGRALTIGVPVFSFL